MENSTHIALCMLVAALVTIGLAIAGAPLEVGNCCGGTGGGARAGDVGTITLLNVAKSERTSARCARYFFQAAEGGSKRSE